MRCAPTVRKARGEAGLFTRCACGCLPHVRRSVHPTQATPARPRPRSWTASSTSPAGTSKSTERFRSKTSGRSVGTCSRMRTVNFRPPPRTRRFSSQVWSATSTRRRRGPTRPGLDPAPRCAQSVRAHAPSALVGSSLSHAFHLLHGDGADRRGRLERRARRLGVRVHRAVHVEPPAGERPSLARGAAGRRMARRERRGTSMRATKPSASASASTRDA